MCVIGNLELLTLMQLTGYAVLFSITTVSENDCNLHYMQDYIQSQLNNKASLHISLPAENALVQETRKTFL